MLACTKPATASSPPPCWHPLPFSYFLHMLASEITLRKQLYVREHVNISSYAASSLISSALRGDTGYFWCQRHLFWVKVDWRVFWTLGWHHIICLSVAFVGGILSVCDTPEQLHGFKKVSRASVNIVIRSKWVKFHFGVSHPFKLLLFPPKAVSGDTVGWRRVGHFVTNETSVSNI